jgi:hypothetical protein
MGWQRDPRHQDHAGGDEDSLGRERRGGAGGEQCRPDRWAGQLVERDEPGLQSGIGQREIVAVYQHRGQRRRRVVGEDLGRGQQRQRQQRPDHRNRTGDDRDGQHGQDHGTDGVGGDHDPPPVEPIGQHTRVQAEQQRRRPPEQGGQRDQERVVGQRRHQQRPGRDRETIAEIRRPRRGQQPPVAGPQPGRHERLDDLAQG